ncbi:acyl-CoA-binding domain-containing protein 5A [Oryzias melastigma]|uniref:acyl-CoA-binding domain-containing protein 5A n=1 Tax=Oryzias melastigma TaxID=30732 RepID=UPI00168CDD8D|nr:acyl-CoA-binding domain-containing protein 5A [Oryzias melastigma]
MEVEAVSVEEERRLVRRRFEAAVKVIKSLAPDGPFQPSNDMMLKFYSYYKQATLGPCNIPRPGFWDAVGKAKWDAWNSLGDMEKEEAMSAYVDEMKLILEGMPMTDEVEELLKVLGPFYELVDEKKKITQISDLSAARLTRFARQLEGKYPTVATVVRTGVRAHLGSASLDRAPVWSSELRAPPQNSAYSIHSIIIVANPIHVFFLYIFVNVFCFSDKKSAASQPKKKSSSRRHKIHTSDSKLANGGSHLTNGNHSHAAPNSEDSAGQAPLNGLHVDPRSNNLTSDSDSEVYCDSVDQFGHDESPEHQHSLDELDDEELQDDPPQPVRCGGEEGQGGGNVSQTPRLHVDRAGGSGRRGRGTRSPGHAGGPLMPTHSGGDGDGGRRGGAGTPSESLNEQIVVALARLQEDMQNVLERLHTLEALTASQARSAALSPTFPSPAVNRRSSKPSWWPFDISPASVAFALIWPFVVQWLIRLYLQRKRRRIN